MVIVIPKEVDGLDHVEKNLEKIEIDSESFKFSRREMCLSLPKFKVETTLNLNLHLNNVNITIHCNAFLTEYSNYLLKINLL